MMSTSSPGLKSTVVSQFLAAAGAVIAGHGDRIAAPALAVAPPVPTAAKRSGDDETPLSARDGDIAQ